MKNLLPASFPLLFFIMCLLNTQTIAQSKQMEFLSRAPVAIRQSSSAVYIGWRMLGTDPASISFNVYRNGVKLNATPITNSTNYVDNVTSNGTYTIRPVINGTEQTATAAVSVWTNIYKSP